MALRDRTVHAAAKSVHCRASTRLGSGVLLWSSSGSVAFGLNRGRRVMGDTSSQASG